MAYGDVSPKSSDSLCNIDQSISAKYDAMRGSHVGEEIQAPWGYLFYIAEDNQ